MSRWTVPNHAQGGGGRRRVLAITATAAAAALAIGGVAAAATTVEYKGAGSATASLTAALSPGVPVKPSFTAVASVTPPVTASTCARPASFTYAGTLIATGPGTVTYRWVYSSGNAGPVQAAGFTAAGSRRVAGKTVSTKTAGGGWGEIKVISPVARTSNKAAYKLMCGSVRGLTASAIVQPATRTVSCVTAPPAFTATGSIRAARSETVTYYWARSDGANSAPATLTFTGPGTRAVKPLTIRPLAASGSGAAVLVVTRPVATASSPAVYTLTCKAPGPVGTLHLTGTVPHDAVRGTAYSGYATVSGGTGRYTWGAVTGLPPGLTATASGGRLTISGTPAKAGTFKPTVSVRDSSSPALTSTSSFPIYVLFPYFTLTANLPKTASVGQPYSGTVTATGGDGTYHWSEVAFLPAGLTATANGATLTISGTPTEADYNVTMSGQVSDGESPAQAMGWTSSITVSEQIPLTSDMPLTATIGQPYLGTMTASGGYGPPFVWDVSGLPAGLEATENGATLTISGTPTTANPDKNGNLTMTNVMVSADGVNTAQSFMITVSPAS